jgi:hypothetical protein
LLWPDAEPLWSDWAWTVVVAVTEIGLDHVVTSVVVVYVVAWLSA